MDSLSAQENTMTRELVLRVEIAQSGSVMYSLEPGTPNRRWVSSQMTHADVNPASPIEELISVMMKDGLATVREMLPSLTSGQLQVQIEDSELSSPGGSGKDVVAVGDVTFLESEWARYEQRFDAQ